MENIEPGEEVDTKFMIHGSKAFNFYLPNPVDSSKSRKDDSEYVDKMKGINSLQLIDFDSEFGTLYIGKWLSTHNPCTYTGNANICVPGMNLLESRYFEYISDRLLKMTQE